MKRILNVIVIFAFIFITFTNDISYSSGESSPTNITVNHQLFSIWTSDNKTLRVEFQSPHLILNNEHKQGISLNSLFPSSNVHVDNKFPGLPYFSSIILLPPDNSIPDIKIENLEKEQLPLDFSHVLTQSPAPINQEQAFKYMKTIEVPIADMNFPQEIVTIDNIAWFRNFRIATLKIYPLIINPTNKILEWNKSVLFQLNFSSNISTSTQFTPNVFTKTVKQVVLNKNMVQYWQGTKQNTEKHVSQTSSLGTRYKISIYRTGIYALPYTAFVDSGISPKSINKDNIHIYNQGEEISIWPHGLDDNSFDPQDYILFYGEKFSGTRLASRYKSENINWYTYTQNLPDGTTQPWKPEINKFFFEKYTDENVYWLVIDDASYNLKMTTVDATPSDNPVSTPSTYTTTIHIEKPNIWWSYHFTNEDTFVWDRLGPSINSITYTFNLISPITSSISSTLKGAFVARSEYTDTSPDHKLDLLINGNLIDTIQWDGKSRYEFQKNFKSNYLQPITDLQINKILNSDLYTDWFEITYARPLIAINDALTFTQSITNSTIFTVTGFTTSTNTIVLDVTDGLHPTILTNTHQTTSTVTFSPQGLGNHLFALYNAKSINPITSLDLYIPPDLYSTTNQGDYIIISHPDFITTSRILADFRQAQGYSTRVLNLFDIINEFGDGIYHPIAIKNFIRYSVENWSIPPIYVILVGDGDWALQKGNPYYGINETFMPPYLSFVDPWQGEVDSANLMATVIGDDPLADVIISRIPVNSDEELQTVVDKIIQYEGSPYENWARNGMFIADNVPDDAGDFVSLSENIINQYTIPNTYLNPIRLYQNDYNCSSGKYDYDCIDMRHDITNTINITGALMLNYIGHGSVKYWSGEQIFTTDMINTLNNSDKLPIVLSMTCLDGFWNYPESGTYGSGLAEYTLRYTNGGSIGAFSPTGLGVSTGHDILHRGFYESLFTMGDWKLGDAATLAKLRLYEAGVHYDLLNTFTIFGDPALEIKNPFDLAGNPLTQQKDGYINTTVAFTYSITNTGWITDMYNINITNMAWPIATLPYSTTKDLAPGQSTEISVFVDIPSSATDGDTNLFTIEVISKSNKDSKINLTGEVIAHIYQIYLPNIQH